MGFWSVVVERIIKRENEKRGGKGEKKRGKEKRKEEGNKKREKIQEMQPK
jgi:hypothetical protein